MNIQQINTVSDLINANQEQEQTDFNKGKELLKQVYQLDPAIGKAMAVHILENLLGLHQQMVTQNIKANDIRYAMIWQKDSVKIDNAITSIKEVQLLDENDNEVYYDDIKN